MSSDKSNEPKEHANVKGMDVIAHEDIVLAYWKDHREQMRQSENQRSAMTNYILVIAAAVSGFIAQQHFASDTIPLCVIISAIGVYGALTSAKYHERANYHLSQARALTQSLTDMAALPDNRAKLQEFRLAHYRSFPRLSKLRLNWLWTAMHIGIAFYGLILLVIAAVH